MKIVLCRDTNDGGCVNDKQVRDFMNGVAVLPPNVCNSDGQCDQRQSALIQQTTMHRLNFTYVVVNPAFGGAMKGLQILQQNVPLKKSSISVVCPSGIVFLLHVLLNGQSRACMCIAFYGDAKAENISVTHASRFAALQPLAKCE